MHRTAANTLIFLFSSTIVFHLLILTSIIPYDIVWGGQMGDANEMMLIESISIFINLLFLAVILIKAGILKFNYPAKLMQVILWSMAGFFVLNTLGNLLAETFTEKLFSILTAILAFFLILLARQKA